jgi:hypothetical protein
MRDHDVEPEVINHWRNQVTLFTNPKRREAGVASQMLTSDHLEIAAFLRLQESSGSSSDGHDTSAHLGGSASERRRGVGSTWSGGAAWVDRSSRCSSVGSGVNWGRSRWGGSAGNMWGRSRVGGSGSNRVRDGARAVRLADLVLMPRVAQQHATFGTSHLI